MEFFDSGPRHEQPQIMFRALRRLHGHNLENRGLNNLTEAFQSFMTRTKFFSIGRMRRTWSHSAVEFLKYRRLLPMLVSDELSSGMALDDFDPFDQPSFFARTTRPEDKRITVSNVSSRATSSQIQAFFTKFGKVHSCHFASEDKRQTMYATMSKQSKKFSTVYVTFKKEESAIKAKRAVPDDLTFYGQQMTVSTYVPSGGRKRTSSIQGMSSNTIADDGLSIISGPSPSAVGIEGRLSRSSSVQSVSSNGTISATTTALPIDELPIRVLERIFCFLDPVDRILLERVNKRWLEAAAKAWSNCERLSFGHDDDCSSMTRSQFFSKTNPLRNTHLKAFLQRCGPRLRSIDLSGAVNLLDEKAIDEISRQCPNLTELDISGVVATPNSLRCMSESLQNLRHVAYRGMKNADERHFWNLFKANAKSIVNVDLRGCIRLRGRCFKLFGAELEEVLLDGCRKIDDEVIEDICLHSNGLKTLSLNDCVKLSDESLSLISRNLRDLTCFHLNGDNFSDITLDGLLQLCRLSSLRKISFDYNSHISNEFLEAVVENVHELRSFSIAFAGSDSTISKEALLRLTRLKELVELDVSGLAAADSAFFKSLSVGCPQLSYITARNCSYLGDDGVEALVGLDDVLQRVDLSGCIMVSSKSVQTLLNKFKTKNENSTPNNLSFVNLIVGGTICEKGHIRIPANCRVQLDFNDYSALSLEGATAFFAGYVNAANRDDDEDDQLNDEFVLLTSHRSFVADAFDVEDDSPVFENDKEILEWAQREASQLGLLSDGK